MLVHWIWYATRPSLSDLRKRRLLEVFTDPEDVFFADKKTLAQIEDLSAEEQEALLDKDLSEAEKILNQCVDKGISVCTYQDAAYPQRLKNIIDPPMVLYYKGQIPEMDDVPVIAAVGTRKASVYGLNIAMRMGYQMASCGAQIVSGIAEGVDGKAMEGALLAGGTVVAILGFGADVVYPKSNRRLFEDVVRSGGCLISEFPPETPPYRWNFPKRNRIISGLSNGVVVIEAPERSGSLITARAAAEQGRDVFVLPGNVDMAGFVGSNALLREGAIAVRNGWDVVGEYEALYPQKVHPMKENAQMPAPESWETDAPKVAQKPLSPTKKPTVDRKKVKKPIDKEEKQPYSDLVSVLPKLPENQRRIVELLTAPMLVDEVIAQTGLSAGAVSVALTMLEIKGVVQRLPGNRVELKHKAK